MCVCVCVCVCVCEGGGGGAEEVGLHKLERECHPLHKTGVRELSISAEDTQSLVKRSAVV